MPEPTSPQPVGNPSQVTLKTAFTVCFAVTATLGAVLFVEKTRHALILCIGAALVAVALDHVARPLERKFHLPRWLSILLVVAVGLGLIVGLGAILIPPAVSQGRALVKDGPELIERFKNTSSFHLLEGHFGVVERLQALLNGPKSISSGALLPALEALGGALSGGANFVTLIFLAVFMLVFGGGQIKALVGQAHPQFRQRYNRVLAKTYDAIGGYIGGLLLICGINATLTTLFLALVPRMPFFLPLGILAGASSLVPYAGPIISGAMVTLIVLIAGGAWKAIATVIYFVLYGQLEGNVIGPAIFRRTVHLNPLVTLLSILFLAELMGVVGAILAVPGMAAAQIIVWELLSMRRERWSEQDRARQTAGEVHDATRGLPSPPDAGSGAPV
jgi:predicted PurR-regulated permease PerM